MGGRKHSQLGSLWQCLNHMIPFRAMFHRHQSSERPGKQLTGPVHDCIKSVSHDPRATGTEKTGFAKMLALLKMESPQKISPSNIINIHRRLNDIKSILNLRSASSQGLCDASRWNQPTSLTVSLLHPLSLLGPLQKLIL